MSGLTKEEGGSINDGHHSEESLKFGKCESRF
jgi:hypothetical protein